MADLVVFPLNRRGRPGKRRMDDLTLVGFENQPLAVTRPGEQWHLNAYGMSQIIVIREGKGPNGVAYVDGRHQLTIGNMSTVRDAAIAVQSQAIANRVIAARDAHVGDPAELGRAVAAILEEYER